jgi:adenylate kinase family enzyme
MNPKKVPVTRIHLLGIPGSGKDTNAIPLKNRYPNVSDIVSTGDIFCSANSPKGEYGCYYPILKPHIENTNNGALIPDEIIVQIVNAELIKRQGNNLSRFIFTGYPRTLGQLSEINKTPHNDIFIFLDCTEEIARNRIIHRYQQDLLTNGITRKDDSPEKFPKRLKAFQNLTLPLITKLDKEKTLTIINANGSKTEVAKEILEKVKC